MSNSGCKYDRTGVDSFFRSIYDRVERIQSEVGEQAVEYAVENGTYQDRTGRLRRSNRYRSDREGLTLYNEAPYASDMESRGHDVISGAALFAEQKLREELG